MKQRQEPDTPTEIHADQPTFSSLEGKISEKTLRAIIQKPMNLKHMSPVQAAVLPQLPGLISPASESTSEDSGSSRDILVKAKTGTGKTLGFLIPAIESRIKAIHDYAQDAVKKAGSAADKQTALRAERAFARSVAGPLIISPTRELATQIANEAIRLSSHHPGFEVRLFVGGNSRSMQMREWNRGRRDIIVATPGRLRDLLENEPVVAEGFKGCNMLVLDEADTLLDMGFREELNAIVEKLPQQSQRQTFLFSATVSREVQQIARTFLDPNHQFINCVSADAPPVHELIPQYHTVLPTGEDQVPHLLRLIAHDQLSNPGRSKIIIFLPTTKLTRLFAGILKLTSRSALPRPDTRVMEIHSQVAQNRRSSISDSFRNDTSGATILVSSDVSARGVDYPNVTRVIQIGVPKSGEQYIHRVGRTGRGKNMSGRADLVLLPWEATFVKWQLHNIPMKTLTVSDLSEELKGLVENFDTDNNAYYKQIPGGSGRPKKIQSPLAPILDLKQSLDDVFQRLNPEEIKEAFFASIGFYQSVVEQLRVQPNVVLQGLYDWSVQAMRLPEAPFVSDKFLEKLGFNRRVKTNSSSSRPRPSKFDGKRSQPWTERGSNSARRERNREEGSEDYRERRPRRNDWDGSESRPKRSYGSSERSYGSSQRSYGSEERSSGSSEHHEPARYRSFRNRE
ncbi:P-loop containing nucleoside triphosphate hydrolase protein [Abortiporus biennis]|nr:P-loop containing nucleoside triphosphate hydrolase protein [Abortiporus biennis]